MAGKPGFRVVREFKRADKATLDTFAGASSAQIADSMARMGAMGGTAHHRDGGYRVVPFRG
jgi:hypothetical protein